LQSWHETQLVVSTEKFVGEEPYSPSIERHWVGQIFKHKLQLIQEVFPLAFNLSSGKKIPRVSRSMLSLEKERTIPPIKTLFKKSTKPNGNIKGRKTFLGKIINLNNSKYGHDVLEILYPFLVLASQK